VSRSAVTLTCGFNLSIAAFAQCRVAQQSSQAEVI
jgi:hypothetical protein